MTTIEVKVKINAPIEKVWKVVSDIDNEPRFWKGTKEVRNISKNENTIEREITIAFRDQKCIQEVTLDPMKQIHAKFTKGIINGEKIMSLIPEGDRTTLQTQWDMKLTGMMGMFTSMIKNHIKSGTEQAMQKIKEEIER
ncbi:MAG: SRPBCC family protein [Nitrosopumilus sp.]|jgi:carbon monoxide dehydrogenase subunit G|nr:SRPBCC family protein [Nitrosopumilaceae archaeon]MBA4458618.1 SRPBCC family protein [Nitrosopumilaceae archaeon]RMW36056.1 MAG: SRPBCC family protein [Nitrosopumilus sp.]